MELVYDYPVAGKGPHLKPRYVAGLCYDVGWKDANVLLIATAVCIAEGNGYIEALHVNDDLTEDWGLWQLHHPSHPSVTKEQAFDPVFSTNYAFMLYTGRGRTFNAWAAYTNGAWKDPNKSALRLALDGVRNYLAMKHNVYGQL